MKKIIVILLLIKFVFGFSQTKQYFVTAKNGLNIRKTPNIKGAKIGKLKYGEIVEVLDKNDKWSKIEFKNFPYLVDNNFNNSNSNKKGFVFNKYLKKLNQNIKIEIIKISKTDFFKSYKKTKPNSLKKVTNLEKIIELTNKKIKWQKENNDYHIKEITISNNQKYLICEDFDFDCFVTAYYPEEEILTFECGHASDYSISLKTGEQVETIGMPNYRIESKSKKMRLNGWHTGHECSLFFFEKKIGKKYEYLSDFGWNSNKRGEKICTLLKFNWINDNEFIFTTTQNYKDDYEYFKAIIQK